MKQVKQHYPAPPSKWCLTCSQTSSCRQCRQACRGTLCRRSVTKMNCGKGTLIKCCINTHREGHNVPVGLVKHQPHHTGIVFMLLGGNGTNASDNFRHIAQVEHVLALAGSGEKTVTNAFKQTNNNRRNALDQVLTVRECAGNITTQVPVQYRTNNCPERIFRQWLNANQRKQPCQPLCQGILASAGWTHRRNNLNISNTLERQLLPIVPSALPHQLAQDLRAGTRAIHLSGWHVHVIHETRHVAVKGRTIYTLTTLF